MSIEGVAQPPPGAAVIVQLRDVSLQDAPARVLSEKRANILEGSKAARQKPLRVQLAVETPTAIRTVVWAHVDVDGDGRVSRGDFVTMQSFPVDLSSQSLVSVTLRQVT